MTTDPQGSAAPIVVERKTKPPGEPHRCDLPGFFRRRRLGLRAGAIVRCAECGTRYEWTYRSEWTDSWWEWMPIGGEGAEGPMHCTPMKDGVACGYR